MDMSGEYRIAATREQVWVALNDPEILQLCIPGCSSLEKLGENQMTARVSAKVGPVSANFSGKVLLTDLDPPNGYRITGEGACRFAGFAKGGAVVRLAADGSQTILTYVAEAQVGGKLAQIGSRLIQGTARKMADDFFSRFTEILSRPSPTLGTTTTNETERLVDDVANMANRQGAPNEPVTPIVEAGTASQSTPIAKKPSPRTVDGIPTPVWVALLVAASLGAIYLLLT